MENYKNKKKIAIYCTFLLYQRRKKSIYKEKKNPKITIDEKQETIRYRRWSPCHDLVAVASSGSMAIWFIIVAVNTIIVIITICGEIGYIVAHVTRMSPTYDGGDSGG